MALRIGGAPAPPPMMEEPMMEAPVKEAMMPAAPPMDAIAASPDMMGGGLVDPAVAKYMTPDMRCAGCIHFMSPGSCEIVAGPITPDGVCMLFTPDQMDEAAPPMEPPMEEAPVEEPVEELEQ